MHIYERAQVVGRNDSLALIASQLRPGDRVLDLGMGAGSLGRLFDPALGIRLDGVTLNPAEQQLAVPFYERTWVADLNTADLSTLTDNAAYDAVVCADVLEHLHRPERILAQCQQILRANGRMLISVPNVAYAGLIAELLEGEFRYRPEGLLDHTHLRFFTRRSLGRFLAAHGWGARSIQTVDLPLPASEFRPDFNRLPPAVAEYLEVLDDARSYQFVVTAEPIAENTSGNPAVAEIHPPALPVACFSLSLYWADAEGFAEARKVVAQGRIGDPCQQIRFALAARTEGYAALRLDPADRPGFLHLHEMVLFGVDGRSLWRWEPSPRGMAELSRGRRHQLTLDDPRLPGGSAYLLLTGNDPWFELPLSSAVLGELAKAGGELVVQLGWPLSADYLQADRICARVEADTERRLLEVADRNRQLEQTLAEREGTIRKMHADIDLITAQKKDAEQQALHCVADLHAAIRDKETLEARAFELDQQADALRMKNDALGAQRTSLEQQLETALRTLRMQTTQMNDMQAHVARVENTAAYRLSRPLAHWYWTLRGGHPANRRSEALDSGVVGDVGMRPASPIDVIVPVYRGLGDTRRCVESVLGATTRTVWRLILINDCSPEPEVTEYLREVSSTDSRILLLENAENLGFVGTVNRGMSVSADADVLLLNSDAAVANDWLDRIANCAYSRPRVASVTPFSNNATICSYPRFCEDNALPPGYDLSALDRLFAVHLSGHAVEVPTGVGFCMYIRRACLDEIGLFDVANFGKGYGEENDFCVRASEAGWVNLHACDTFVLHSGGTSFGATKGPREQQAMETIRRLHPGYEAAVMDYVQRDPARFARVTIDLARTADASKPVYLNVLHDRGGGTIRHVRELTEALTGRITFLTLTPHPGGVLLEGPSLSGLSNGKWQLSFPSVGDRELLRILRMLRVRHIHFHHLLGHSPDIRRLPQELDVTYDFTVHDFYAYCPQISMVDGQGRYCGDPGPAGCRDCLQKNPVPGVDSIEGWRAVNAGFVVGARFVLAPSHDAADRIVRLAPNAHVRVAPHESLQAPVMQAAAGRRRVLDAAEPLRIVVIGALSKIKGADLLEDVAKEAARQRLPLDFHLIGYAYRDLLKAPKAKLTVHGSYEETALRDLLEWLRPDIAWFPALCPETYSFTLSSALENGLPIVAPDLGAFPERLKGREWTWVTPWDITPTDAVRLFMDLRERYFHNSDAPVQKSGNAETERTQFPGFDYFHEYVVPALQDRRQWPLEDSEGLLPVARAICGQFVSERSPTRSARLLLRQLIWLRGRPWLSGVARMIPHHVQRRVKSWLLR